MRRERTSAKRGGKTARAVSAVPPFVTVDRNTAPAVSALAPSLAVDRKPLPAFSALPPSLAVARAVVARRVRVLRFVRGVSQEVLAEASGLHRSYVSAIERGRCNLTLESMVKLADAFGVSVVELLDGRGVEIDGLPVSPARGRDAARE